LYIHSLSNVLIFFLILTGGIFAYHTWGTYSKSTAFILVPGCLLAVVFVSKAYIDHWWHKKFPPRIEPKIREWLQNYLPFYQKLTDADKQKFEQRLAIYELSRAFSAMGKEADTVPYDIRCIVSSQAIMVSFYHEDYLIGDMDRIFLYKHPFPTPANQFLHTAEYQLEDGVIILSIPHALAGIAEPDKYYNIALHCYIEAWLALQQIGLLINNAESYSPELEEIFGYTIEGIAKTLGFEFPNMEAVHCVAWLIYPEKYQEKMPELAKKWLRVFGVTNQF
jgi:hypothetical protein